MYPTADLAGHGRRSKLTGAHSLEKQPIVPWLPLEELQKPTALIGELVLSTYRSTLHRSALYGREKIFGGLKLGRRLLEAAEELRLPATTLNIQPQRQWMVHTKAEFTCTLLYLELNNQYIQVSVQRCCFTNAKSNCGNWNQVAPG